MLKDHFFSVNQFMAVTVHQIKDKLILHFHHILATNNTLPVGFPVTLR